jgi:elongation factor Ts
MSVISSNMIKDLRETTGAGMMDCKKALAETNGDMEAAKDWLRKKGLSSAAKKAGRVAAEGLVAIAVSGNRAAMVEVNSETDFVARNDQFQALVAGVARYALENNGDYEKTKNHVCANAKKSVAEVISDHVGTIGENISFRRSTSLEVKQGVVATYIHNAVAPNMGRIGVLVALESAAPADKLQELGKQIAMHVAAAKPEALKKEEVSAERLEREKNILREQSLASGKPADVVEKMMEGRLRKFYEEIVLPEQLFVIDGKTKVADYVADFAKKSGSPITISGFRLFILGDGIEKQETDFAAEVKAAAGIK